MVYALGEMESLSLTSRGYTCYYSYYLKKYIIRSQEKKCIQDTGIVEGRACYNKRY